MMEINTLTSKILFLNVFQMYGLFILLFNDYNNHIMQFYYFVAFQ